jgi:hypothetical protein
MTTPKTSHFIWAVIWVAIQVVLWVVIWCHLLTPSCFVICVVFGLFSKLSSGLLLRHLELSPGVVKWVVVCRCHLVMISHISSGLFSGGYNARKSPAILPAGPSGETILHQPRQGVSLILHQGSKGLRHHRFKRDKQKI